MVKEVSPVNKKRIVYLINDPARMAIELKE